MHFGQEMRPRAMEKIRFKFVWRKHIRVYKYAYDERSQSEASRHITSSVYFWLLTFLNGTLIKIKVNYLVNMHNNGQYIIGGLMYM
jgi:hypothetical protein